MKSLKQQFNVKFEEYLKVKQLEPGLVQVPVENILQDFLAFSQTVPATKAMLGRALTKKFLKKQCHVRLTQTYFLNKNI
jgi:hypothetical protein